MRFLGLLIVALPVVLTQAPVAQDPVPSRIAAAHYGYHDAFSPAMWLDCNVRSPISSEIRLDGGAWGDPACVLIDARAQGEPWIWGPFAVSPSAVPIVGVFGVDGAFCFPIDLAMPELVGNSLFMQGACVRTQPDLAVELTRGFEMSFYPGNAQPALQYAGPDLTALLCKVGEPFDPPMYDMLLRFEVPTYGYRVEEVAQELTDHATKLYVRLVAPMPPFDVPLWTNTVRYVAELGSMVAPDIEVWVQQSSEGSDRASRFELAAVARSDY